MARDIKALGASVVVVGGDASAYEKVADFAIAPGAMMADAATVALLLPLQIFAFATALCRNQNPDAPVNLSKVVIF